MIESREDRDKRLKRELAERCKSARNELDLPMHVIAARAGVCKSVLANVERARNKSVRELTAIAAALGVEPLWLAKGIGPRYAVQRGREPTERDIEKAAHWAAIYRGADDATRKAIDSLFAVAASRQSAARRSA